MKKIETHYTVVGSSALKNDSCTHIIEFPLQESVESIPYKKKSGIKNLLNKVSVRFHSAAIQGYSVNKAKPWQSALAGTFFFVFAMACVYFGR